MTDGAAQHGVETTLRDVAPRVLGAVVRRCGDFAAAEDAVQEALLVALVRWRADGMPANPAGWLFTVALRRLSDVRDSEEARREREEKTAAPEGQVDESDMDVEQDDTLELMFTCCHPALSSPSAIALTLRAVGGLTTAEIAGAFLVPEATMAQRISRAKQSIQSSGVPFDAPGEAEHEKRLAAVQHVLYLTFNEGYTSTTGPALYRVELSVEAIRLTRALQRLVPEDAETAGLLALMLLTDARRTARSGPRGELIPLDEQDRSQWDRASIDEGTQLVTSAFARKKVGPYQVQAAIAAVHDAARTHAETDWNEILGLYGVLQTMSDNPMVALNRMVAHAMVHGPADGLRLLDELEKDERIAGHYRIDAVRGHLCEMAGDRAAAIERYRSAAGRTQSLPERDYLITKAARLANP